MTAGRADQRLHRGQPARLLVRVPGRQPGLQELRVRRLRLHRLRQGARGLLQHLLLPGRLQPLAAVRHRHRRRERPRPAGLGGQGVRLRQPHRHRPAGRGVRPDRRPQVEARLLQVDEGLLLRDRRQAAGRQDQRLRLQVRPRVLHRGLRLPRRRRRQLRDRPGRHDRHARSSSPARTPRSPTAARSTSPASARRSSAPTAPCCAGSSPRSTAASTSRSASSTSSTAR